MLSPLVTPPPLKMGLGNWVSGPEHFFRREEEISDLRELLVDGESVMLVAPRRAGKTSLLHEVARHLPLQQYHCLHLDLEAATSPAGFFHELARAGRHLASLRAKLLDFVTNIAGPLAELHSEHLALRLGELFDAGWQDRAERLFARIAELPERSIFFVDEVPLFFLRLIESDSHGRDVVEGFLSLLRSTAQRYRGRIQFVIAGSIGLVPLLQRLGLSAAINHYVAFELRPWNRATVCNCLRALGARYGLAFMADAEAKVADLLGVGVPHHVQLFFAELRVHARRGNVTSIFPDDVDEVYRNAMLARAHQHLSHMHERLKDVFVVTGEMPLVEAILAAAANTKAIDWIELLQLAGTRDGAITPTDLQRIVDILVHDGYLMCAGDDAYSFVPGYVRDWWRRQHSAEQRISRRLNLETST